MIGIRLTIPIACWRKARARELVETEMLPPPATCYGALLSLVGETERARHIGCRVTGGIVGKPDTSVVVRTFWKIKDRKSSQGSGENAKPDFQQLLSQCDVVIWCDSEEEREGGLEQRVQRAITNPREVSRFGGWCLGESTHLINDAWLLPDARPPTETRVFVLDERGMLTLPVWVDHVGTASTRYAVGSVELMDVAPPRERMPKIVSDDNHPLPRVASST